jgi:CHAT domain-containing protein/Tfp pilus assembly protein PilF
MGGARAVLAMAHREVRHRWVAIAACAALGCVRLGPPPGFATAAAPETAPAGDDAARLDERVEQLFRGAEYQHALPLAERSLALREHARRPDPAAIAISLVNLATIHNARGAYAQAEGLYLRSLAMTERARGPMHPETAGVLNGLAALYYTRGAFAKAEPLLVRALAIQQRTLGAQDPDLAMSLSNLGSLYKAQGAFAKAEPLYLQALAIRERVRGATHPETATTLDNLATLYLQQGAYGKAEPPALRALAIREHALGPMHPEVATSLNNLAVLYVTQRAYGKAEPLYLRALAIVERSLGAGHVSMAELLNNLGLCYQARGAHAAAEPLHTRALDIATRAFGPVHPVVADALMGLGLAARAQGAHAKAGSLMRRALAIREQVVGALDPSVARDLVNLARVDEAQGAYADAEAHLARAVEIEDTELSLELPRLSGPRKQALLEQLRAETETVVSLHADAMPTSETARTLALTTVLRRKGVTLDSLADNQAVLRTHVTAASREQIDQLTDARAELATMLYGPQDARTAASRTPAIAALRGRIEDLEGALNTASAEFRAQAQPITIAKLQAALPVGGALVELVRYRRVDPTQVTVWRDARYVGFVVTRDGPARSFALGDAAPIDAAVDAVLAAMHPGSRADATRAALQHLDALVLGPLHASLAGVSHVLLSPDGKLNLVPLEALVDPQGRYELERRLVSYVTSGRDLLRLAAHRAPRGPATVIAAPDYGPPDALAPGGLGVFRPLDGALAELTTLTAHFAAARTLTGRDATKAALAATVGPAVLHISTHGFFARDPGAPAAAPTPVEARGLHVEAEGSARSPPAADPGDALDRAGLALAGANLGPDGIVTARELAGYDWWGTQLVVLAACDTGVGAVSGDGVYGMRRALVLAGTESQVVSLWKVSDAATSELMRRFYGELAQGTGRAEALRRAKLAVMLQPRFAHPYYWAAFIPAGDWTPLDPGLFGGL